MAKPKKETDLIEDEVVQKEAFESKLPAGIPIESAQLQTAINVVHIGTQNWLNQSKQPGISMVLMPYGLHVNFRGKEFVIPNANVTAMVLAK